MNEVILVGIKEIVLVIYLSKNLIENYFDMSFELEVIFEKCVKC